MENLNPQVLRHVGREIQALSREPLEGISLLLKEESFADIEALIEGPADTPFAGGKFRVKLVVGKDFPASPPKGYFLTKIFHPNVASSTGEICVNTLKKDWKSDLGIKHVLLTIKCLLIVPNPESALNEEAGKLLLERYDDYCARAKLYTEIHASGIPSSGSSKGSCEGAATTSDKKTLSKKEKSLKEKKKTLKRL
uniref:E2 ubiquitin-conjugating enzyme n=1 Tax=Caligus rogercresseyi TaxID=217165 RepID=C1BRF0_CALRO|nr:Ubiquitin-conjugating enzyme E2 S [Caligus rogercresseyi]